MARIWGKTSASVETIKIIKFYDPLQCIICNASCERTSTEPRIGGRLPRNFKRDARLKYICHECWPDTDEEFQLTKAGPVQKIIEHYTITTQKTQSQATAVLTKNSKTNKKKGKKRLQSTTPNQSISGTISSCESLHHDNQILYLKTSRTQPQVCHGNEEQIKPNPSAVPVTCRNNHQHTRQANKSMFSNTTRMERTLTSTYTKVAEEPCPRKQASNTMNPSSTRFQQFYFKIVGLPINQSIHDIRNNILNHNLWLCSTGFLIQKVYSTNHRQQQFANAIICCNATTNRQFLNRRSVICAGLLCSVYPHRKIMQ